MARIASALRNEGFEGIPLRWQTFVALGIVLVALGIFAMGASSLATLASVLIFGWALIIGGILQAAHAITQRRWGGRMVDVLTGVLFVAIGALAVWRPLISAVSLTLVIAVALMIRGVFAIVAAVSDRYHQWGWGVAYGVVSVVLGLIIASQWPGISLWIIGLMVGIELLVDGVALAMTGFAARKARHEHLERRPPPTEPAPREPVPREPLPAT